MSKKREYLRTYTDLRSALKRARYVFAIPSFNPNNLYVRISKKDVQKIIRGQRSDRDIEMWDIFMKDGNLYLGE